MPKRPSLAHPITPQTPGPAAHHTTAVVPHRGGGLYEDMPDVTELNRTPSRSPPPPPPLGRRPRARNPARILTRPPHSPLQARQPRAGNPAGFLPRLPRSSDPTRFTNPRLFQRRPLTLAPVGIRRTYPAAAAATAGDTKQAGASAAVPAAAAAAAGDTKQELGSAVSPLRRRAKSATGRSTQGPRHRAAPIEPAAAPLRQPRRQRARSATREEVLESSMTSLRECFRVLENVKHSLAAGTPAAPLAPAAPVPRTAPMAPTAAPPYAPPYRVSSPVQNPQSTLADLLRDDTQSRKRLVK